MQKIFRILLLIVFDILAVNVAFLLSFYLRLDSIPENYLAIYFTHWPSITIISLLVFYFFRLYKSVWRYASTGELLQVGMAAFAATALLEIGRAHV